MDLQELKKVEDLNQKRDAIQRQVYEKIGVIQKQKFNQIFEDFQKYFEANDFKVLEGRDKISQSTISLEASYGKLKAILSVEPDRGDTGKRPCFELTLALPIEKVYSVFLKYDSPNVTVVGRTSELTASDVEIQIENAQKDLENVNNIKWYLDLWEEGSKIGQKSRVTDTKFDSIQSLLKELIK